MCSIGLDRVNLIVECDGIEFDSSVIQSNYGAAENKPYTIGAAEETKGIKMLDRATGAIENIVDFEMAIGGGVIEVELIKVKDVLKPKISVICPRLIYSTNERNIHELDKLKQIRRLIYEHLDNAGIFIGKAAISSIEINSNIQNEIIYHRGATLIRKALSKAGVKVSNFEGLNEVDSLKANCIGQRGGACANGKTRAELKVYKKSLQLTEEGNKAEKDYLTRFEVSTKHTQEIQSLIGAERTLEGLCDNWDRVVAWYKYKIKKTILEPLQELELYTKQTIIEMLEDGVRPYKIPSRILGRIEDIDNLCIDHKVILAAVKEFYKKTGNSKNYSKVATMLLKALKGETWEELDNKSPLKELYKAFHDYM